VHDLEGIVLFKYILMCWYLFIKLFGVSISFLPPSLELGLQYPVWKRPLGTASNCFFFSCHWFPIVMGIAFSVILILYFFWAFIYMVKVLLILDRLEISKLHVSLEFNQEFIFKNHFNSLDEQLPVCGKFRDQVQK